jgi:hypothetical protein
MLGLGAAPPRDRVGHYAAPSLFVAGVGKCGTNALSEHLALHPQVAKVHRELAWDPRETPPADLVAGRHILPSDTRSVWVAKHPKYALATDVAGLARRLRSAYPSARLGLALCDPLTLPWRRFLFLLSSALTLHGRGTRGDQTRYRNCRTRLCSQVASSLCMRVRRRR